MKTEDNEPEGTKTEQPKPSRVDLAGLDVAISLLNRMKTEVAASVLAQLRGDISTSAPKLVADELERSGRVKELAAAEISKRAKILFSLLAGAAGVLGIIGATSLAPLVDRVAQEKVDKAVAKHREELHDLEVRVANSKDKLMEQQAATMQTLGADISKAIREAQHELDQSVAEAKKYIGSDSAETLKRLDDVATKFEKEIQQTGSTAESSLERKAADQALKIAQVADSATKNIRDTTTDSVKQLVGLAGKDQKPAQASPPVVKDDVEASVTLVLATIDQRQFDKAFEAAKAQEARPELSSFDKRLIRGINPFLFNPKKYPELRVQAAQLMLSPKQGQVERASSTTEVLVSAAKVKDTNMLAFVDAELQNNPIAKFNWDKFEKFVNATLRGASPDELARRFDEIELNDLTGIGLANLLSIAKSASIGKEKLKDVERRLINTVRTTTIIDRPSDYCAAWLIMDALVKEPQDDPPGIQDVAGRIGGFIFEKDDDRPDPWNLRLLLKIEPDPVNPIPAEVSPP